MVAYRTISQSPPLLGEPMPLELANTTYAAQGQLQDGLQTTDHLAAWLDGVRTRLETPLTDEHLSAIDDSQVALARDLRDSIRELAQASVDGTEPQAAVLDRLNRHAGAGPRWRELRWEDKPRAAVRSRVPPVTAALSEIAEAAVELFASPRRADIRVCGAPGCVLFFLPDRPRRAWCSTACGNRVRAARHYERARAQRR